MAMPPEKIHFPDKEDWIRLWKKRRFDKCNELERSQYPELTFPCLDQKTNSAVTYTPLLYDIRPTELARIKGGLRPGKLC